MPGGKRWVELACLTNDLLDLPTDVFNGSKLTLIGVRANGKNDMAVLLFDEENSEWRFDIDVTASDLYADLHSESEDEDIETT